MLWLVTILALAEPPGAAAPAPALRLATAATSERVDIAPVHGSVEIEVLPLDSLIRLRMNSNPTAVAARIAAAAGQICPDVRIEKGGIELRCRTPQLDATLNRQGDHLFLDIHELRGLPWRLGIDGPPLTFFEPVRMGMGGPCPGDTAVSRAECALNSGRFLEAAKGFRGGLTSPFVLLAQMRLGDLALIAGDPQTAIGWFDLGSRVGVYGRVSAARLCEFDPECITMIPTLDPDPYSLPGLLRDDVVLRGARAAAFAGKFLESTEMLRRRFETIPDNSFCRGSVAHLCQRLVLAALRNVTLAQGRKVLEVYLMLPERTSGPVAGDLATQAGDMAARLGAPVFGASLLAAVTGDVTPAQMNEHLLRTAELYLLGRDPVRARVVLEFAESKGFSKDMRGARWSAVRTTMRKTEPPKAKADEPEPVKIQDQAAETLAAALGLSARIDQFLTAKAKPPEAGQKAANTPAVADGAPPAQGQKDVVK